MSEINQGAKGKLVVKVVSESQSLLPGATVVIKDMMGNVIQKLQTDQYGNTKTIDLHAPSKQHVLKKPGVKPYSQYIVTAQHPNYAPVQWIGVQIFEGSKAIPTIKLPSLQRYNEDRRIHTIVMDEHPLYSGTALPKITEDPYHIPEPPPHLSPYLLHTPTSSPFPAACACACAGATAPLPFNFIIPENIRVHLGLFSDDTARNIDVPFVEYIKRVLHIEILDFTEQEAIAANVIAAVSYTLNRIYTQWYRLLGKDYDITTGTDRDHAYALEYTPQEPLVRGVDKYFNEFIAYPGQKIQPFFAQYCNGKEVTCAYKQWLEQIGSAELARRGMNYREILKHYYGDDKNIIQARVMIEGGRIIPIIKILQQGDVGSSVELMQQYLGVLGEKWGIDAFKEAVEEHGRFGSKTFEAVKLFQKVTMHLPLNEQNGVIDQKTWLEIIKQYNVMTRRSYRRSDVYPISNHIARNVAHSPFAPHPHLRSMNCFDSSRGFHPKRNC
ncbi:spore cortex-lytic protein [Paenibacillus tyrfis]|uniref:peptidoglycan-binding domain-containing protein n=1 Tax=Paenibacillus tyrfis TaxID=1501230 RepID=UPI002491565B|nr:hypothetical protein [Paenibacillus tyrfis]GLI09946.1 spore cortex-lytic protein [Paenibacillus tyrfis]